MWRAQLEHLLRAVELPTVTLQVLPTRPGAHPALASPFTLLSFGDLGEPDIAYVEHTLGAVTFDKEPDVARAGLFFDRLRAEALGLADSATLVRGVLDGSGRAGTGGAVDGAEIRWFKSSFSSGNANGCVEVAFPPDGRVAVRDTKDRELAPHHYTPAEWDAFLAGVRAGEFDRP